VWRAASAAVTFGLKKAQKKKKSAFPEKLTDNM
jgi:hypothetical protein